MDFMNMNMEYVIGSIQKYSKLLLSKNCSTIGKIQGAPEI